MKLKNIHKGAGIALAALLVSVALSTSAKAVVLAPGAGPVAINVGTFQLGGTLTNQIAVGTPLTPGLNSTITGTFGQVVYGVTGAFGGPTTVTQDFYYRFTIATGTVTDSSAINFSNLLGNYVTDVSFLDAAAMQAAFTATNNAIFNPAGLQLAAPDTVSRSNNGLAIDFAYDTNELTAGETTFVLKIRTDAPLSVLGGTLSVQSTGNAAGIVYQPDGVPVPEPTAALFGCALVGTVLFSRKRKGAVSVA